MQHVRYFLQYNGRSVSADSTDAASFALLHAVSVVVDKFIGRAEPPVLETMAADPTKREMIRILTDAVLNEFHLDPDNQTWLAETQAFRDCVDVLVNTGYVAIPTQE